MNNLSVPHKPKAFDYVDGKLVVNGQPEFKEWEGYLKWLYAFAELAETSLQWAIGDALNYGEDNYPEQWTQALCEKYVRGSKYNIAWVARSVPPENRRSDLTFHHHRMVAKLPPEQQKAVLEKASKEVLSVRETKLLTDGKKDYKRPLKFETGRNYDFETWYKENQEKLELMSDDEEAYRFVWGESRRLLGAQEE